MSDFNSGFWEWYIGIITVVSVLACAVLLKSMSTHRVSTESDTTGHTWDEDLGEYNNPLPRWWIWLFYITIAFSLVYLLLYPGLGSYAGSLKWTSTGEYEAEMRQAEEQFGPLFQKFASQDLRQLAADPEARAVGQKLFLNHCSRCHGSDAAGGRGFPNLTDHNWLYGGDPETIKTSIMNGRNGVMPPLGPTLGESGTRDAANYVLSLSGAKHDPERAARGKKTFTTVCAACHGADGKGNQALGAPNLTDTIWEYGGSEADIIETITRGRGLNALTPGTSAMPAHKDSLGETKVHILAAYVYGLSNPKP